MPGFHSLNTAPPRNASWFPCDCTYNLHAGSFCPASTASMVDRSTADFCPPVTAGQVTFQGPITFILQQQHWEAPQQ